MRSRVAALQAARVPATVAATAVAVAVLGLLSALAALLLVGGGTDDALRADALQAARDRTAALTSYDHRTLDDDFARVSETATGAFAEEYAATTEQLRGTFEQRQAVATGEVIAVGLESLQDEPVRAVAVVAVDQLISTSGEPARTERNRLRMTLVRPGETWLVERVERL